MAVLSPSFLFGVVALVYLLSFVFFAIVRIATGVSIQRFGYFSLRRIAYTPRDGIRIDLRGLALRLHRPTFARPTYISLRLTELRVTFDPAARTLEREGHSTPPSPKPERDSPKDAPKGDPPFAHNDTWKKLTQLKETIKALHNKVQWLSIVDLEISDIRAVVPGVGEIQVGSMTAAIDTRRSTVDRNRLFRHKKEPEQDKRPAEWMFVIKGILFTPDGSQALEIIDILTLNVHGLLYKEIAGLRDVSVSLKIGRINIPYDEIMECRSSLQRLLRESELSDPQPAQREVSLEDMVGELNQPGSREDSIVRTVTESREFMASLLRGIQEIQLGVSFIGFTKKIDGVQPHGRPVYANMSMNEIGVDLFRLDQKSPAHRMYFSPKDVAHQALIAAISLAIGIDDGQGKPERIFYVPMATSTIKTTLPSRTLSVQQQEDAAERNANMLFANFAVTSPSIDIGLKHITVVLALLQGRRQKVPSQSSGEGARQKLISRLLPKANVRISVQEPVARVVLPPADKSLRGTEEYDLLISSISSISLSLDSSHSSGGELHYALTSTLRITSEELYYQTSHGIRHNLLSVESLGLKVQLAATPEVSAIVVGNLDNVSAHLVRQEIGKGIYKILQQIRTEPSSSDVSRPRVEKGNFLRKLPPWLVHLQFRGSNLGIEVAGSDEDVSEHLRGLALQLQSCSVEYKLQKSVVPRNYRPRSEIGGYASPDESIANSPFVSARKNIGSSTDGRKLSLHTQGFEGFIVEGVGSWEPQSFLSIPRAEVSFTTSSDSQGQIFHTHVHTKALYLQYSLYRYYALGIAGSVLRKAFQGKRSKGTEERSDIGRANVVHNSKATSGSAGEAITIDMRAPLIQIKATMPSDPPMMLQVYGLDYAQHRWASPFMRAQLIRLYAEAPRVKHVWARVVSLKSARIDLRKATKIIGKEAIADNSIDIQTEFVRLAVPHQLVMYRVLDNFVNTVKATEQLHHRFKTETNDYVLQKEPEGPKKLPKVSVRSRTLMFELEDSSFDWRLDLIYRVGLKEQKQRLAREEAYRLKIKKLIEQQSQKRDYNRGRQGARKNRGRSVPNSTSADPDLDHDETAHRSRGRRRSSWGRGHDERYTRYDADAGCVLTGEAKVSADEAWLNLQHYNAASWKKRISYAMRNQSNSMKEYRRNLWGDDDLPEDAEEPEPVVAIPSRPGLMMTLINDFHLVIDKPSFPIDEYPKFLHDIGKGMPYDMKYSLLIPMNIQLNMGETRISLRNYPLPLLHVPGLKSGQSSRLPSWSLKTDFVIAEEFRNTESMRHVKVEIVPPSKITEPPQVEGGFAIDVRRTVSPVKTYSCIDVVVNTKNPTTLTWGTAYQPAIQDMMQTIESFTRPQVDPSEKVGFWDKIRLSFHSRARIAWTGGGDVHLKLKGTRDPYLITGYGAGFVWCFRQGVRWDVHQTDDPKEFMTVSCGEYIFAIPDYSEQARYTDYSGKGDADSVYSGRGTKTKAEFRKVIMKLSGNVRWLAGLVFERETADRTRSFEFCKHFEITTKTPEAAKKYLPNYDAFRGFRSQHIHLSIAVIAPVDRDWSVKNLKASTGYNTAHLSPRFFTHFFDWWSTFQGSLQLPVRQGPLFPGVEKSSKKFGRHLATIKYNLLLSPLFLAHIYKHKDADEYNDDVTRATGLKVKLDSFMLDMHQRRETFATQRKAKGKSGMTSGMKINQAQLDFINADFRAVSSAITGTSPETIKAATEDDLSLLHLQNSPMPDESAFTIPDNDYIWVDMDDFVELDWVLPAERHSDVKIMPLAFSPRFTYFRQTEHNGMVSGDATRTSQFGDEPTHFCVMSQDNDPRHVQRDLVHERIQILEEQIKDHEDAIRVQEQKVRQDAPDSDSMKHDYEELRKQADALHQKKAFMDKMLAELGSVPGLRPRATSISAESNALSLSDLADEAEVERQESRLDPRMTDFRSDFNNRFTIHNIQLKWNNSLRDIILRYVHQVSQRRGFTYYMTRSAVKFILDILGEQKRKGKRTSPKNNNKGDYTPRESSKEFSNVDMSDELRDRIEDLAKDASNIVNADNGAESDATSAAGVREDDRKEKAIAEEFTAVNSYHVRLIAPQIQLQSEKNSKSVLLVTARGIQLKVIQIMDKSRISDDVSGLVQRRFLIDMDRVQFFVTNQRDVSQYLTYYSHLRYGAPKGTIWPPWAPLEVNFDSRLSPFGWFRVVQETSINLKYEKYNNLRLKYNNEVMEHDNSSQALPDDESEQRVDHISVEFPQVKAICDSSQYYSMFVIVSDLLLYSEPLEKKRNERLEKIMLAADFSDLSGTPEMVENLQDRIRQLEEIRDHFLLHLGRLEKQGWQDRLAIEHDLSVCEEELFFMMKAITSSQRKIEDRSEQENNGVMRWNISADQIAWHLVRDQNEPLAEFQLKNAMFDRTDNSDGSNHNVLEIGQIFGLNLMPEAIYPQMIAPYDAKSAEAAFQRKIEEGDITMLRVNWHMLEAIAGIPVLSNFEVNLFPLKIQLEQHVGKRLFEYVFPPGKAENGQSQSPFMAKHRPNLVDNEDSDIDLTVPESPASTDPPSIEPETRAGSMDLRLRPTLNLTEMNKRPSTSNSDSGRRKSEQLTHKLSPLLGRSSRERERSTSRSRASVKSDSTRSSSKRAGADELSMTSKISRDDSNSNLSGLASKTSDRSNRFGIRRSHTTKSNHTDKEKPSDELTEMMSRASNYMTLAYVKIPSVILCLSYKGKNDRNFVDVHDFVFTMPTIEYRNKTWSNMDLVDRVKKDVVKALISHTGAIIGNKFSHHRPSKNQQSKLRELASSSTMLPNTNNIATSLVRSATTFRHRSMDKTSRLETHSDAVHEEQTDREQVVFSERASVRSRGVGNEDVPKVAINGQTFNLVSPTTSTNGGFSRPSSAAPDNEMGHVSDRPSTRPGTRESSVEPNWQTPKSIRSSESVKLVDDDASSTQRRRKSTVLTFGKKILHSMQEGGKNKENP